jgi:hypothetical protein
LIGFFGCGMGINVPLELSEDDPFASSVKTRADVGLEIRDRGAADDKGQLMSFGDHRTALHRRGFLPHRATSQVGIVTQPIDRPTFRRGCLLARLS